MCGLAYRALTWKPQTLTSSLGHNGHLSIAQLFAFPFLQSHLVYTCSKCILLQFKDAVKIFLRSVLQIQSRACWDCWIFYVAFFLFGGRLCTICGPHAQISIFFSLQTLLTLREHLIYIYNEYIWLVFQWLLIRHLFDTCVQTGVQQGSVNMQSLKTGSSGLLWTFKKLWTEQPHCPETTEMLHVIQMCVT